MTQFYALKRYPKSFDWSLALLWTSLLVLGITELVLALWKVWDIAIFIKAWWGK